MVQRGAFCDPSTSPTEAGLRASLSDSWPRWSRLADWMRQRYGLAGEPLFTGADSGWALRFRRSGRSLLTLSPQSAGGFRALVVLGPSCWDAVPTMKLGAVLRAAWDNARAYPDGRWLFVPVEDDETVADIMRLVELKSPPPLHPRPRSAALAR